jgi:cyanophycinase
VKRENELINVLDAHPELLGIGLDDQAALLVRGARVEILGAGRVAIYDDRAHDGRWFYYLTPGTTFDLSNRSAAP